jgi:hypothetical protein
LLKDIDFILKFGHEMGKNLVARPFFGRDDAAHRAE